MSNIESTRSNFFPKSKVGNSPKPKVGRANTPYIKSNNQARKSEIESLTAKDARVKIPNAVKDFAKIKTAVDMAPEIDNTDKIANLKNQIKQGTYSIDYDALADKMLGSEY